MEYGEGRNGWDHAKEIRMKRERTWREEVAKMERRTQRERKRLIKKRQPDWGRQGGRVGPRDKTDLAQTLNQGPFSTPHLPGDIGNV